MRGGDLGAVGFLVLERNVASLILRELWLDTDFLLFISHVEAHFSFALTRMAVLHLAQLNLILSLLLHQLTLQLLLLKYQSTDDGLLLLPAVELLLELKLTLAYVFDDLLQLL